MNTLDHRSEMTLLLKFMAVGAIGMSSEKSWIHADGRMVPRWIAHHTISHDKNLNNFN